MRKALPGLLLAALLAGCGGSEEPPRNAELVQASTLAVASKRDGDSDLYVVRADGAGLRRLTNARGGEYAPSWSPDGRRVAFAGDADGDSEIYVADPSGRDMRQITRNRAEEFLPAWSPDGRRLAFASNRTGAFEIYVAAADGSRVRRLTRRSTQAYGSFYPAWSPDGTHIAFAGSARTPENQEIYVVRVDGTGLVRLTRTAGDSERLGDDSSPSWSPDGERIVFASNRTSEGEIWIMRSDGSGQRRLAGLRRRDETDPRFSPDGTQIAFASLAPSGRSDVYVVSADGTGLRRLVRSGESPAWRGSARK